MIVKLKNRFKKLFSQLKKNWRNKRWWKHLYRDKVFIKFLKLTSANKNRGIYVVDEKWDNLIILDDCRYDIFKEINTIPGKLESKISRGSSTADFVLENFKYYPYPHKLKDIVYVSTNPTIERLVPKAFHKIYSTWIYGWSDEFNTVLPEEVVKDALRAREENPDKRMIVHFMQPHCPFLDPSFPIKIPRDSARDRMLGKELPKPEEDIAFMQPSFLIELGKIDKKTVWEAYKNNLKIVLPFVNELIKHLSGKIVVTSDHGEMMGEKVKHFLYPFKEYGHPRGLIIAEELVKVPWLIVKK